VVNLREGVMLTANAAFAEPDIPVGRTFFASHSGTMIGALMSRGKAKGIGFAGLVSIGNEVDLSIGEICAARSMIPTSTATCCFSSRSAMRRRCASSRSAPRRAQAGRRLQARPLVAARELAVTHTGALAGEDDVASAFLADCGIARVESLEGAARGPAAGAAAPRSVRSRTRKPTVAVLTTTAGGAIMVVDPLAMRGVEIAQPAPRLCALRRAGIAVTPARIVDLTVAGTRYDVMKAALDVLTTAPEFDLVLAVVAPRRASIPSLRCGR
jgi:acyl-CoA synthetase (NDP forming)